MKKILMIIFAVFTAGTVCAVTGLSHTLPGDGLGFETNWQGPLLEPVLTYQVELTDGTDPQTALQRLRQLEEEDPQLHVVWNEQSRQWSAAPYILTYPRGSDRFVNQT